MADKDGPYRIEISEEKLIFRTSSYKAEKGSVLHSGIYNRELTSSLAAGAAILAIALALILSGVEISPIFFIFALAAFAVLFLFFRIGIFYEESLEAVIDKSKGIVTVSIMKFMGKKYIVTLNGIQDVSAGHVVFSPENIDGIKFVEKVALQHGTVIPGFGEKKEFHTVEFKLKDGASIVIFSGAENDANEIRDSIEGFIHA